MSAQLDTASPSVGELSSKVEIAELIYNYCHGLDRRELDRFMSIWTEDAVWQFDHPQLPVSTGREAISGLVQMFWGGFGRMHHLSSNVLVTVDGDTATAVWDAAAVFENAAGATLQLVSSYSDEFRRVDGLWKTSRRFVTLDPQIDLGG